MNSSEDNHSATNWSPPLARADGFALCTAAEAILKGFLETELDVHLIVGVRRAPFDGVFRAAELESNQLILKRNGVRVVAVQDSTRAVELAAQEAARGRRVVILIPNDELDTVVLQLAQMSMGPLGESAGICVVMEDNPFAVPTTCPRRLCRSTDFTAVEPCDLAGVRDSCDATPVRTHRPCCDHAVRIDVGDLAESSGRPRRSRCVAPAKALASNWRLRGSAANRPWNGAQSTRAPPKSWRARAVRLRRTRHVRGRRSPHAR